MSSNGVLLAGVHPSRKDENAERSLLPRVAGRRRTTSSASEDGRIAKRGGLPREFSARPKGSRFSSSPGASRGGVTERGCGARGTRVACVVVHRLAFIHAHTHTHTHTHTRTHTHHTYTHTLTHTYTHTRTHARTVRLTATTVRLFAIIHVRPNSQSEAGQVKLRPELQDETRVVDPARTSPHYLHCHNLFILFGLLTRLPPRRNFLPTTTTRMSAAPRGKQLVFGYRPSANRSARHVDRGLVLPGSLGPIPALLVLILALGKLLREAVRPSARAESSESWIRRQIYQPR